MESTPYNESGVRVVQGRLAHTTPPPPQDPTAALCLGTCGDP